MTCIRMHAADHNEGAMRQMAQHQQRMDQLMEEHRAKMLQVYQEQLAAHYAALRSCLLTSQRALLDSFWPSAKFVHALKPPPASLPSHFHLQQLHCCCNGCEVCDRGGGGQEVKLGRFLVCLGLLSNISGKQRVPSRSRCDGSYQVGKHFYLKAFWLPRRARRRQRGPRKGYEPELESIPERSSPRSSAKSKPEPTSWPSIVLVAAMAVGFATGVGMVKRRS